MGLVGESGSGKSTLGQLLLGLQEPTQGQITLEQKPLPAKFTYKDHNQYAGRMQMIFQDPYASINPRMTAAEIVSEGLIHVRKLKKKEALKKTAEWMEKVGLAKDHMNRYPHEFSGGQRQRIGIARALAVNADFIVCDEPISALDVSVQAQIVNLLKSVKDEYRLTLLFIAHDLSMVRYISERIIVMYLGEIVESGPSEKVFYEPRHPYTQLLISANPVADPALERKKEKKIIRGEITSPIDPKPGCRFAERCPLVEERCKRDDPPWVNAGHAQYARCHLVKPAI